MSEAVMGADQHVPKASGARLPLELIPELAAAVAERAITPWRSAWRRNWFYRRLLKGKLCDRLLYQPSDLLPRQLERAELLLRGRFRFGADSVEIQSGSIFDKPAPSCAFAEALHGFEFLPPLATAGGEPARVLATNLITQWIKRYPRYREPQWQTQVMARRLINLFIHGRFVITNSDLVWRSKLFVSLREQSRLLARIAHKAPEGMARLEAAAALTLSGACLDDAPRRLDLGLERFEAEINAQILPDGGHINRSPESLLHAFRYLIMVIDAAEAMSRPVPARLLSARDRMAPMLRFFRNGQGTLALFNGGHEGDRNTLSALLQRDEAGGMPFGFAPHSKFQRLAAAKSYAVMDVGPLPDGVYANTAHAGCLSFEFSSGAQRLVVNCGSSPQWDGALRSTAAHSTVTVADSSMAQVLGWQFARRLIGPRMLGGPHRVDSERVDAAQGTSVSASHDGYLRRFGLVHARQLSLSADGARLIGKDRLLPKTGRRGQRAFAIRFHIHPDIRVTQAQDGGLLLKLPGGEGWRFRCAGEAAIEESIYVGGDSPRRCEQIVITGRVDAEPVEFVWMFERMSNV
ncbi:MAG: heparinase II/III family protein [Alphaproteobacteria bacterium]|nr:heparinase II/III family protein [Alphaproteobacteria bacterium]